MSFLSTLTSLPCRELILLGIAVTITQCRVLKYNLLLGRESSMILLLRLCGSLGNWFYAQNMMRNLKTFSVFLHSSPTEVMVQAALHR